MLQNKFLFIFDLVNDLRLHLLVSTFLSFVWFLSLTDKNTEEVVLFALFTTLLTGFAYSLNRYTDYSYDLVADKGLSKFSKKTYLIAMFFFLSSLLFFPLNYFKYAVLGIFFGVIYSLKTLFKLPLKNYLFVKNIFTVIPKWTFMGIGLYLFTDFSIAFIIILSLNFAITILINTIIWDVRDIEADKVGGVRTIPNVYGKEVTILLCLVLCFISFEVFRIVFGAVGIFTAWYYIILVSNVFIAYFVTTPRFFHLQIYLIIFLKLIFVNQELVDYVKSLI